VSDDNMEYTVGDMRAGIHEVLKWVKAGSNVVIEADGVILARVIPYVEWPDDADRMRVRISLPPDPES
jgi:antitoxin (DNA-binding transcriptional repressor) of toxin-antitoxin stability system